MHVTLYSVKHLAAGAAAVIEGHLLHSSVPTALYMIGFDSAGPLQLLVPLA